MRWLYNIDELALIMIVLVSYIGVCVASFASRYMQGDASYRGFFFQLIILIIAIMNMVGSDHLVLLLLGFSASNFILVRLMMHKTSWRAAYASGVLAAKHHVISIVSLVIAFYILYLETGQMHISGVIQHVDQSLNTMIALSLILVAAMVQSAIWPLHRWLISSLNSPTPVSAIMHAGLINGGGVLLVRFAPLYIQHHSLMLLIFSVGLITALLGTLWQLMQSNVKGMLACSTMGQMGFMFVQCGLGLFPLAVAHLVWHGLFKAYLFLGSASAAQDKRFVLSEPPQFVTFICALVCGLLASVAFAYASHKSWGASDSTLVLVVLAFLAGTQLAIPILQTRKLLNLLCALVITITAGLVYGSCVHFVAWLLQPMGLMQPQILHPLHIISIIALTLTWLSVLFLRSMPTTPDTSSVVLQCYVNMLNASQPATHTVTAYRNHYKYQLDSDSNSHVEH